MEQNEIQKRVRTFRTKKGLSQEDLANQAELSLRTIQRIENGETRPRGDTLRRMATALQVSPEELIDWQEEEDHNLVLMFNLSQLGFLAFPLLGIIIPLIIWVMKKKQVRHVDTIGLSILNFQISWNLLLFSLYSIQVVLALIKRTVNTPIFHAFLGALVVMYLYNLIMIVANSYSYWKFRKVLYFPAIRFLK